MDAVMRFTSQELCGQRHIGQECRRIEFAESHKHSAGKVGQRARLALTFAKFRPK